MTRKQAAQYFGDMQYEILEYTHELRVISLDCGNWF
jgi:hypothetical protein